MVHSGFSKMVFFTEIETQPLSDVSSEPTGNIKGRGIYGYYLVY